MKYVAVVLATPNWASGYDFPVTPQPYGDVHISTCLSSPKLDACALDGRHQNIFGNKLGYVANNYRGITMKARKRKFKFTPRLP